MAQVELVCLNCDDNFFRSSCDVKRGRYKFCSRNCSFKYHVGERATVYKGGWINSNGYKKINLNGKEVYEHRHVVETKLKRKLESHEDVHHIDGNKLNNSFDNLQVLTKRNHTLLHNKVGERNSKSKLTANQVVEIRELNRSGINFERLAENFGVDPTNISMIIRRKTWKHI